MTISFSFSIPVLTRDEHLRFLIAAPAVLRVDDALLAENRGAYQGAHLRLIVGRRNPNLIPFLQSAGAAVGGVHVDDGLWFDFQKVRLIRTGLRMRDVGTTRTVDEF